MDREALVIGYADILQDFSLSKKRKKKSSGLRHVTGLPPTSCKLKIWKGMGLVFVTHR